MVQLDLCLSWCLCSCPTTTMDQSLIIYEPIKVFSTHWRLIYLLTYKLLNWTVPKYCTSCIDL
jgi:hypothetical protein